MLTTEQRLSLYLILLVESDTIYYNEDLCDRYGYDSYKRTGLCKLIKFTTGEPDYELSINDLPELMKRRPTNDGSYWFLKDDLGWAERKRILEESIIECETILYNEIENDVRR